MTTHVGRSWEGHRIEDNCPCPKTACGLVDVEDTHPECREHPFSNARTVRQSHPDNNCPETNPVAWAAVQLQRLDPVIAYMEATMEDTWQTGTVRSADGITNCFFGHLFAMGGTDARGNALWDRFESVWSSTFMLYPINDGTDPRYPQATPKQRVLAYLQDLNSGAAKNAPQLLEEDYNYWLAGQGTSGASVAA